MTDFSLSDRHLADLLFVHRVGERRGVGSQRRVALTQSFRKGQAISERLHIPRTLHIGDRTVPEADLLTAPGIVIVLAEPGAGKTDLLDSVADRLGVARFRASIVRPAVRDTTLIVDAFDEVARVGDARVYDILHKIREAEPERVLLSSRSGEWENARTRLVQDLFGQEPQVAHLVPLNDEEQLLLFEYLHPQRSFSDFHADIRRFDLHHILGNPEFLRLFAGAYDEADGRLPSRRDVFTLAIQNLARESNPDVSTMGAPSRQEKLTWANEIFSKLLLSGVDGVALGDIAEDDLHPQLETIGLVGEEPLSVLGTRLFRPGTAANQHEPVHRIVAEYGRGVVVARGFERFVLVVDDLEEEHPDQLRQALSVAVDADVLAHDVLDRFDEVSHGHVDQALSS